MFQFNKTLNPKLWNSNKTLKLEVRLKLLEATLLFYKSLDVKITLVDVQITGSNASYTYTNKSDIDIHLITNFKKLPCEDAYNELFLAKKKIWSETHNIKIKGYEIEFYVENELNPVKSNGVFSLLKNKWLHFPNKEKPKFDDNAVQIKTKYLINKSNELIKNKNFNEIEKFLNKLKSMRSHGLESKGEFSTENLAFKNLRALGYIDKLKEIKNLSIDKTLSLESKWI